MKQDETERLEHTEASPERDLLSEEVSKNPPGWKERLVSGWTRKPIWTKGLIAGSGTGVAIFAVFFVVGEIHHPPAPHQRPSGMFPGPIRIQPTVPVRSALPGQANVAGIVSAGAPGIPSPGGSGAPPPPGMPGPAPAPEGSAVPVSPELLWRQVGAVAVAVARLSETVQALSAEEGALLRGQEWMMKEMTRMAPEKAQNTGTAGGTSSPLTDDRTATPAAPAQPELSGWRVIGVSGNGAVLMDPAGTDHLVRKDSVLKGRTVVSIDPESGHVRLSDGEVLAP